MKDTLSLLLTAARRKELPCLLIGGNAVILLGLPRMTIDVDLLVPLEKRTKWLDLMRELNFKFLHGTAAFAQFNPGKEGLAPVDLMFVDAPTWENMEAEARDESAAGQPVRVPRVEHLIALKLHAANSATRDSREQDWEDIRHLVRAWHLDPDEAYFREIILRHGGDESLERIRRFKNE